MLGEEAGRAEREVLGGAALEEGAEVDAVVGGAGLLGEHGDPPAPGAGLLGPGLQEALADHAVADQDEVQRRLGRLGRVRRHA